MNPERIKKDFPIFRRKINGKPLIYFNNAATTQKPRQVLGAVSDFYERHNGSVHRGTSVISAEATELYTSAREKVADFIGAEPQEIVYTKNATESINLVAYSLIKNEIGKGDEVLITKMEHHSNLVPWQQLSKPRGFKVKFVDVRKNGELAVEQFKKKVSKKTKLVSVLHCSNVLGTVNPVREIVATVQDKNPDIITLVDGAQSVPHMPVDVKKINCDFLAFSGHKMLGPEGIGILYGREEMLWKMRPFLYGGDMIREVHLERTVFNKVPEKFEAGTPNAAGAIGLGAAISYLEKIGMENVFGHEKELTQYALKKINNVEGVKVYGFAKKRTGVVPFNLGKIHPHDVAAVLDKYGISIRAGDHCAQPLMRELGVVGTARASFYIYNSKKEIDVMIEALEEAGRLLA